MAWYATDVEEEVNPHAGILYVKKVTYNNTSSSSITYKQFAKWMHTQILNLLDSLPDGYIFQPINIWSFAVTNVNTISTTGSSHANAFSICNFAEGATNGVITWQFVRFDGDNSHHTTAYFTIATNTWTHTDTGSSAYVTAGASKDAYIYFVLYKSTSTMPTI